jgi:hypothetical protein
LLIVFYIDFLLGVHLPGLVRSGGAAVPGRGPPSRRGGSQSGLEEPPLERASRGEGIAGGLLHQMHADQPGAPGGMLPAPSEGGLGDVRIQGSGDLRIVRSDAVDAAEAKPPDQTSDGHARQAERLGDLTERLMLLPESKDGLPNGHGDGAWHGTTSRGSRHEANLPVLYQC